MLLFALWAKAKSEKEKTMYTIITTEEYKELILDQVEKAELQDSIIEWVKRCAEAEDSLKELLLTITQGKTKACYEEFKTYELATDFEIAEFINRNYVDENGILNFTKVHKENENEQSN